MDHVTTRRTALHPAASEDDRAFIHRVLTDPANSAPFVWHGSTPGQDALLAELEPASLALLIVRARRSDRQIGVVMLTNPNLRDGHGFLTVAADPTAKGRGLAIEGLIGLIHLAFSSWPFFKLYADVDDVALDAFGSAVGRYLTPEGRFRGHHVREGRRVDVHRLALYRSTWESRQALVQQTMQVQLPDRPTHPARQQQALWAEPATGDSSPSELPRTQGRQSG
jgi:RimJ/RimL family protein N-acetyltransferase